MRTTTDRIRHAISFEIIGLVIVTFLGQWAFGVDIHHVGAVAIVGSTMATVWNYIYNLLFDHAMLRLYASVHKTPRIRIVHALLFELGILLALLPFIAWYLEIGLLEALLMDISFSFFYLVYAFLFNWAYDIIFPVPEAVRISGHRED